MVSRAPRHLVLQDCIVAGRKEEDGGAACGLTVLAGAAAAGGDAEAEAAAPPPVVLAVAYRAGCVDIALVPAGVGPRCALVMVFVAAGTAAVPAGVATGGLLLLLFFWPQRSCWAACFHVVPSSLA